MKRTRVDGQLSKEDYDSASSFSDSFHPGEFARATPNTMASRRLVTGQRISRKQQFGQHIKALNQCFYDWVRSQMQRDDAAAMVDGFQDYVDHVTQLEDRYLRSYGEVLTFGSGDCGQLAHGVEKDEDLMVKFPRVVYSLRDKRVVGIACGGIHNAVFTETGQVYTWGCADDGSLGRPGDESTPLLVDGGGLIDETVVGVACGDGQTMAVTAAGTVYGWGCYKDKEGKKFFNPSPGVENPTKDIKRQQNTPQLISGLSNIVEVCCGSVFNIALCSNGKVYSWGLGESGELGRKVSAMKKPTLNGDMEYDLPKILDEQITPGSMYIKESNAVVQDVKAVGCGAYHTLLICIGDMFYACGLNNYGQLGLGSNPAVETESQFFLTPVDSLCGRGVISCKGGVHHSLVLTSSGEVLAFGRADSGQLGNIEADSNNNIGKAGDFASVPVKPFLPADAKILSIACGGNHNLALAKDGSVYTWGYGDMYALGHGLEKDEPKPRKLNFTKAKISNITITQVAGGGQHSAIIGQVLTA